MAGNVSGGEGDTDGAGSDLERHEDDPSISAYVFQDVSMNEFR